MQGRDVLLLDRDLLSNAADRWTDEAIRLPTRERIEAILEIWPAPAGHRSNVSTDRPRLGKTITLADLIAGGALQLGQLLYPRLVKFRDRIATLLADGSVEMDGVNFAYPSEAATRMTGRRRNGWSFFLVDPSSRRSLRSVRQDYLEDDVDGGRRPRVGGRGMGAMRATRSVEPASYVRSGWSARCTRVPPLQESSRCAPGDAGVV